MLANSIYKTLAFFDAQGIALSLLEIKNYLDAPAPLREIERIIAGELLGRVESNGGLYFLEGREALALEKKARYHISLVRFHKAKKYLRLLRHFPFLRAVAISGSQAFSNAGASSDIDLFIITKPNRIWLARTLVSLYFQMLRQRRHGIHISNRFCLNHYLAGESEITEDRNLYTATEYASLIPVLGQDSIQKFWASNPWVKEFVPNIKNQTKEVFFGFQFSRIQKAMELILDHTVGGLLNRVFGSYQKHRIKREKHILVSDRELSFHPGSRGQQVLANFQKKL